MPEERPDEETTAAPRRLRPMMYGPASFMGLESVVRRAISAVFKKAAVLIAHALRIRHALATEVLTTGGTEEDVADILGIGAAIVRKTLRKWTPQRQERIATLLKAVCGETTFNGCSLTTQ